MKQDEKNVIDRITETVSHLLKGKIPEKINVSDLPNDEIRQASEMVNELIESLSEVKDFIVPLSEGYLDMEIKTKHFLASPFKQLQSNLRHLTWQTQEISEGDFTHQVDFMGDFSKAFNSMVAALDKARKEITAKNRELDSFAYRVSHDLKNPIALLLLLSSQLLMNYKDKLDQRGQHYLDSIQKNSKK